MTSVKIFTFNPFQENTYILFDKTGECVIIDPGCYDKNEVDELTGFISSNKLEVQAILNTHCHIDHVLGNSILSDLYKVKVVIPKGEEEVLRSQKLFAPMYGFPEYREVESFDFFQSNTYSFGNTNLELIEVPGHSPDSIAFYNQEFKFCIVGDALFNGSIGRTDLPGGDYDTLISSITQNLFKLPDNTAIFPGHGLSTRIGDEKESNPFVGRHALNQ